MQLILKIKTRQLNEQLQNNTSYNQQISKIWLVCTVTKHNKFLSCSKYVTSTTNTKTN